jgi:hypothetical protein
MGSSAQQKAEVILGLAREVRQAIRERDEAVAQAINRYDGASQGRLPRATELLQVVQKRDQEYEHAMRAALERYREAVRGET